MSASSGTLPLACKLRIRTEAPRCVSLDTLTFFAEYYGKSAEAVVKEALGGGPSWQV